MPNVIRMARQAVRGLPYLEKELSRRLSISTGTVLATPMTYYVIFSGRCNLECPFCTIYKEVDPILTAEQMFRIVREAKALSGKGFNISLSGGEPMIFKPLYDTLALAHSLGVNFGFTTNGLALTKGNCERLLSHNPFNINVSLESVDPAVNESLRPMKEGTRRTLEGIAALLAEKERARARVSIIVKPTIMEQNYRGLPALVRHFGRNSGVQINFQPYVGDIHQPFWIKDIDAFKGVLDEIRALQRDGYSVIASDRQLNGFLEYFASPPQMGNMRHLDLGGEKRNCDIGLRSMFIYANGDVHFCDFLGRPIGNIHQKSLSDIYYGTTAGGQRKEMIYCNIDCQQTCKRPIPLWVKARAFLRMG
jgi:MoaA/NifB/PqqE/SkfB family radical SAM enzyme